MRSRCGTSTAFFSVQRVCAVLMLLLSLLLLFSCRVATDAVAAAVTMQGAGGGGGGIDAGERHVDVTRSSSRRLQGARES
jgi:hypothetical protein